MSNTFTFAGSSSATNFHRFHRVAVHPGKVDVAQLAETSGSLTFQAGRCVLVSRLDPFIHATHSRRVLTLIVGTNRPGSNSRKVARQVEEVYAALGVSLYVLDLAKLPPEIFFPASYAEKPKSFAPFSEAVLAAEGLIVVTPEYNGSVPGVLKYFIDMLKFPESFEKRPVCFVGLGAGMWGALRPVEQLQLIFGYRNAFLYPERVFLPGVNGLLDDQGRFTDPEIKERLREQAAGFVDFVERLKGVKLRVK